jgi:hypothetical protein
MAAGIPCAQAEVACSSRAEKLSTHDMPAQPIELARFVGRCASSRALYDNPTVRRE